ncbi:hypothetical protein [Streptomyces sp. NPDC007088]|uniref:hypothetical protein n=1 Tax=Streptomyces sp. NPDC007088 TaxID=3364773 RepID=UPI0036CDDBAA
MATSPRALTVGLRANTLLGAPTTASAVDAIRQIAASPHYAAHILTPRTQTDTVHDLLTGHGIHADINTNPERQFWNSTDTVLVTSHVVQADVRIGRGIVLHQGDWTQTLPQLEEQAGAQPRRILSRFDGVIHDRQGWQGGRLQEAVTGAPHALRTLLQSGHCVHISTQRPTEQLPQIARWLADRDVPAVADAAPDTWEETGTVLVTGALLPADLEIENRALNLSGDDWAPLLAELPARRAALHAYLASRAQLPQQEV